MPRGERRLAAIMFTDMVGYTALGQKNESLSLALVEEQRRLIRPILKNHNGREVKTMGDAFLVDFPSALDAVKCAYDIQRTARASNASVPEEQRLHLRIGVHLGDVVESEGDISGDAVNIASRVQPLAEEGSVCLTRQVYDQVQNKLDLKLRSLGTKRLKNVSAPVEVYKIVMPWDTDTAVATESRLPPLDFAAEQLRSVAGLVEAAKQLENVSAADRLKNVDAMMDAYKNVMPWLEGGMGMLDKRTLTSKQPEKKRIAVLPFANMSANTTDEYFADGMTEEIISTLSRIEGVEVISRTSVMQYKKTPKTIKDVSTDLDAGTVLEGSVRKAGNRLRVTVQMIDAAKDRHLWSESYDRKLENVFAIQTDIARRVAEALQGRMPKAWRSKVEPARNVEAYTLYLRAMQLSHDNAESSLREAVELFGKAISKDPGFVRAYAGLAHALCGLATGYEDFTASVEKAEAAARKALELGPEDAEAYLAMAYVHTYLDKFDLVTAEAEKAIQINPNLSEAYSTRGWILSSMGKLEEGVRDLERAARLDPMSFRPGSEVTLVFQLAGKEKEAQDFLEKLQDLYPRNHRVYARWAEFYLLKHDFVKAQEMLDVGLRISPSDVDLLTDQGVLYAMTERRRQADAVLETIKKDVTEASRLQGTLFIKAAMGELDEAFPALLGLAEMHAWPPLVMSLPVFEGMRKDTRFKEFCTKVGLPP